MSSENSFGRCSSRAWHGTVEPLLVSNARPVIGSSDSRPPDGRVTPYLLVDLAKVEADYREFLSGFSGAGIFYAVKANPHPGILSKLETLGAGFEISSLGEFTRLRQLGVNADRIISSNPVKVPEFIVEAGKAGVNHFAFDSKGEVDKLSELASGAELSIRLTVPNTASDWPLDKKFGVDSETALELLIYATGKGLRPVGITFHVGSQCRAVDSWTHAMTVAKDLWDKAARRGLNLTVLNVGGGMPVAANEGEALSITAVGTEVMRVKAEMFPESRLWVEPGRAVVGRAGTLVTAVIGSANRGGTRWVFVDAGIFHGLTEAMGGIRYSYLTDGGGPKTECTLAGPSCDSVDVIAEGVMLPELKPGDLLTIPAAGAYTTVYSSEFNGFGGPETIITEGSVDA